MEPDSEVVSHFFSEPLNQNGDTSCTFIDSGVLEAANIMEDTQLRDNLLDEINFNSKSVGAKDKT